MKRRLFGLLLICVAAIACATAVDLQEKPARIDPPSLLILNKGPYDFVVLLNGKRIGQTMGSRTCVILRPMDPNGPHYIALRQLATDAAIVGPAEYLPRADGWKIEIGMSPSLEIFSLQPAGRCGGK